MLYDEMTSVPAGGTESEEKKSAQHRVRARGGGGGITPNMETRSRGHLGRRLEEECDP